MITITEYTVNKLNDPFGILAGDRYEYSLDIDVAEDDELYTEGGLSIRLIFVRENEAPSIVKYDIVAITSGEVLEFDLEDDELAILLAFCSEHYQEADGN